MRRLFRKRPNRPRYRNLVEQVGEMWMDGVCHEEIAYECAISRGTVINVIKEFRKLYNIVPEFKPKTNRKRWNTTL